jgi:hypothetical protein
MADRHDVERRRRDLEREERLRRERRGPQGFNQDDWSQRRRSARPVENPLEEHDDYRRRYYEDWEDEGDWAWEPDREAWMDYGRDYDSQQDWRPRRSQYRQEKPWQEPASEPDYQTRQFGRPARQWGSRGRSRGEWDDHEMDYGRGVYDQRRGRHERRDRDYDEGRWQGGRGDFEGYRRQEDRGYGDVRGRGYGWEGGYMDPYNRGFFRREEGAHPDYLKRYNETHLGDEWDTGEEFEGDVTYTYTEFWLTPGPFSGVGPIGYQRSDDRIFEDVCYRMAVNGQLDPSEIDVNVEDGEVTLEGKVQDRHSKRLAEDIADSVSGVSDVHNRLRVGERQEQRGSTTQEERHQQIATQGEEMEG